MELKSKEREKVEGKKEILERIKKAGSEEYITEWDNGGRIVYQKKKSNVKKGKKSKQSGARFELRTREDLINKGFIVDKWSNNIDLETKKIIPAKRKFNPFSKVMTIGTGFPDFIAFQLINGKYYKVIGVECKINNKLSKEEKEKCAILLKNKVFNEILIASKNPKKRKIEVMYENFSERYLKFLK